MVSHSHKAFSVRLRTHGCRRDLGHGELHLQWPQPLSSVGTGWTWTCFHIHPVGALWGWLSRQPGNRMQICTQSLRAITEVAIKQLGRCTGFKRTKTMSTTFKNVRVYLSTFIAAPQHRTVFPVVKVQSILCEWLILFTAEYTQAERSDQAADQIICLQITGISTVTLKT